MPQGLPVQHLLALEPPGWLAQVAGQPRAPRAIGALCLPPCLPTALASKIPQALAVKRVALPVDPNCTTWIAQVQAVLKTATSCLQTPAYFREEGAQIDGLARQLWPVEARCVGHQGAWSQLEKLHVAGGVAPPLQPPRHRRHPQAQLRAEGVEHAALADAGGAAQHGNARLAQPLAEPLQPLAGLDRQRQGLVAPGASPPAPVSGDRWGHQIGLGKHQQHRPARGLGRQQEAGELQGVKLGLGQGNHHHHPGHVGHRRPLQQAVAGLQSRHGPPARRPVDTLQPDVIPHGDGLTALAKPGASGAEQAGGPAGAGLVQLHPAVVGEQGNHQPAQAQGFWLNRHGTAPAGAPRPPGGGGPGIQPGGRR